MEGSGNESSRGTESDLLDDRRRHHHRDQHFYFCSCFWSQTESGAAHPIPHHCALCY